MADAPFCIIAYMLEPLKLHSPSYMCALIHTTGETSLAVNVLFQAPVNQCLIRRHWPSSRRLYCMLKYACCTWHRSTEYRNIWNENKVSCYFCLSYMGTLILPWWKFWVKMGKFFPFYCMPTWTLTAICSQIVFSKFSVFLILYCFWTVIFPSTYIWVIYVSFVCLPRSINSFDSNINKKGPTWNLRANATKERYATVLDKVHEGACSIKCLVTSGVHAVSYSL